MNDWPESRTHTHETDEDPDGEDYFEVTPADWGDAGDDDTPDMPKLAETLRTPPPERVTSGREAAENVPVYTFTVSVRPGEAGQVLTCAEIAAELRRAADSMERGGHGPYAPDFSGEWHIVHPRGAVVSDAFWGGGDPYTGAYLDAEPDSPAHEPGTPAGAWRPWLAAGWTE
jgi:hypothetical protein